MIVRRHGHLHEYLKDSARQKSRHKGMRKTGGEKNRKMEEEILRESLPGEVGRQNHN